jgi:hypothetical protein
MGKKRAGPEPKVNAKKRPILTPVEIQFCQFKADGAGNADAARWAGVPENRISQWAYEQMHRPLVVKTIEEIVAKIKESVLEGAVRRKEERERQTHQEYCHRLRKLRTHKYRGDEAIVKLIEIGFRSTGAIQPVRVSTSVSATAAVQNQQGLVDIYKPLWLREREAQLLEEARQQALKHYPQAVLPPASLTPEKAKEYLVAAKGDKDVAREAARKDGWQV